MEREQRKSDFSSDFKQTLDETKGIAQRILENRRNLDKELDDSHKRFTDNMMKDSKFVTYINKSELSNLTEDKLDQHDPKPKFIVPKSKKNKQGITDTNQKLFNDEFVSPEKPKPSGFTSAADLYKQEIADETEEERLKNLNDVLTLHEIRTEYEDYQFGKGRSKDSVEYEFVQDFSKLETKRPWDIAVGGILRSIFKIKGFRLIQRAAVNAVLSGRDVFCCMPTGGGKSLVYQVPTMYEEGFTVVFMPIISLIQDQMGKMEKYGIEYISTTSKEGNDNKRVYNKLADAVNKKEADFKFLFITPEMFSKSEAILSLLQKCYALKLFSRIVIDECHCVSGWGHEFRPDYLNLANLKKIFPNVSLLCLTATATKTVREDVMYILHMNNPLYLQSSFNRTNLRIGVIKKDDKKSFEQLETLLKNYEGMAGIVYCSTTNNCDQIVQYLTKSDNCTFSARPYHAKMAATDREDSMKFWLSGEVQVIVATIAFGMGVDKPNVRFVIHYNFPKSVENLFQEAGRAGRDGMYSDCILMYSQRDCATYEFLISKNEYKDAVLEKSFYNLNLVQKYCEDLYTCRRQYLLLHFGEDFDPKSCEPKCDNCIRGKTPRKNYGSEVQEILKIFSQSPEVKNYSETTVSNLISLLSKTSLNSLKYSYPEKLKHVFKNITRHEVEPLVYAMVRNSFFEMKVKKLEYGIKICLAHDPVKYDIISERIKSGATKFLLCIREVMLTDCIFSNLHDEIISNMELNANADTNKGNNITPRITDGFVSSSPLRVVKDTINKKSSARPNSQSQANEKKIDEFFKKAQKNIVSNEANFDDEFKSQMSPEEIQMNLDQIEQYIGENSWAMDSYKEGESRPKDPFAIDFKKLQDNETKLDEFDEEFQRDMMKLKRN